MIRLRLAPMVAAVALLASSASATAATPSDAPMFAYVAPPPAPVNLPTPEGRWFKYGARKYAATVWGLRMYLDKIRTDDPALFEKLDPELSSLETRRTVSLAIGFGGVIAGMALVGLGLAKIANDGPPTLALIGLGTTCVSALTAWIVYPGSGAVEDWIEHHNALKPDREIELRLGLAPARGGFIAGAVMTWR